MTLRRKSGALSGLVFIGLAARFFEVLNNTGSNNGRISNLYVAQHRAVGGFFDERSTTSTGVGGEPPSMIIKNEASRSKRRIDITTTSTTTWLNTAEEGDDVSFESNQNRQQQQKQYRPSLILHVGPHKTGTTTLQMDMADHFTDALAQDKFVYLGKRTEYNKGRPTDTTIQNKIRSVQCLSGVGRILGQQLQEQKNANNNNSTTNALFPPCWIKLQQELDRYHKQNTSIILSDEDFSHNVFAFARCYRGIPHYFDILEHLWKDWNVVVVIGYRRYAEWALSSVKQFQHGRCFHSKTRPWAGWANAGGEKCPEPFDDAVIPAWMRRKPFPSARVYHSYQEHQQMWQEQTTFETRMLNFHSQEHLSTTFFCQVLTNNTPHTCDFARNRSHQTAANKRSVANGAYSNIAFAAAAHELVNTTTQTRQRLTNELQHYHQQELGLNFQDLPLKCPTRHQLQELLNISLAVEQAVMPELYHAPGNVEEHERSFWRMADAKKEFCSVDTDILLQGVSSMSELKERLKQKTTNSTSTLGATNHVVLQR